MGASPPRPHVTGVQNFCTLCLLETSSTEGAEKTVGTPTKEQSPRTKNRPAKDKQGLQCTKRLQP